jgi:hypothetical protein
MREMIRRSIAPTLAGAALVAAAFAIPACSSSDAPTIDAGTASGGVMETGGTVGSGGVIGTGGGTDTGGAKGSGGAPPADAPLIADAGRDAGASDVAARRDALDAASATGGRQGSGGAGGGGTGGATGSGGATGTGGAGSGGATSACIGADLLAAFGKDTVLVGGAMEDATAAKAPFDGRYLYLSGGLFDGTAPCISCASGCSAGGDCSNSGGGCAWWGCWQYDQDPPGQYAVDFVSKNEKASPKQLPMLTYYEELQASKLGEGKAQVAALNDAAFLTRYLGDWRFVLQKIGTHPALLHIEPDFWGYVEQSNADPHAVPAKVTTANATDCAGYENSAAGVAKCMIHMVRLYAPNARVGVHASAWGTNMDVFGNSDVKLDVVAEAKKMATFLTALGAKDGDFIVSDPSDRDAGYYQVTQGRKTWWDATNATLPNFHQAFTWTRALAEAMSMPVIYWQIPVGNMSLDNTNLHYQDNRLDYFFTHMDEVAAAHIVGLFFGAGADGPTTPESDGGNFVSKTADYRAAGGTKLCP